MTFESRSPASPRLVPVLEDGDIVPNPAPKGSTSPWRLDPGKPKKPTGAKHDSLCIEVTAVPGQKFCWCNCTKCWQGLRPTGAGRATGVCICRSCNC